MNLENLTILQAHKKLKNKETSSVELTKAVLDRIKKTDNKINAFITVTEKEALKQAEEADKRIKTGKMLSKLDGIPVALKDNMATEGILTTAGSKILENFKPPYDATVVKKIKDAGAIIIGKTNMDEFAMGSSCETSYFGPTKNPWDTSRVPGGSSGGSAAAVSASQCIYALGSDTGGSIRQPASFCGCVGLKPTYGRVSRYGLLAMASSLDQIGPLVKNTEDAAAVLEAISGYDGEDSTSVDKKFKVQSSKFKVLKNVKIGIAKEYFREGLDKKVEDKIKSAIKVLESRGAKIENVSLPHTQYTLACYYIIMPSEASTNLARYDGIKYGYSTTQISNLNSQNLLDVYLQSRAEGFGDEVKRRIMLGTHTLSSGYYDQYYLKAAKVRTKIKEDFDKAFSKVDVLITPTSPTVAFPLGEKLDDPLTMYLSDIYTVPVNLAGVPAISVPCGLVKKVTKSYQKDTKKLLKRVDKNTFSNNLQPLVTPSSSLLPVGLQIIGPQWGEEKILQTAYIYEQATKDEGWRKLKPSIK